MPQKYKLTFRPENTSIEVPENTTLMEALKEAGIFLDAPCGGRGTCGKCLVKISENEADWTEVRACQTKVKGALLVDTENSRKITGSSLLPASAGTLSPFFFQGSGQTKLLHVPLISAPPPLPPILRRTGKNSPPAV